MGKPGQLARWIGVLLIVYGLYGLARPVVNPVIAGGAPADAAIGFFNGINGAMTGLAGIFVTIWCGLRGGPA
jgi:hypothetical protein